MGFLETLTLVFVVLKLTEVIEWTWLQVFSPMIIGYAIILLGAMTIAVTRVIQERRS